MSNIIRFIQHFVMYWSQYPEYLWFKYQHLKPDYLKKLEEADAEMGIKPHDSNRWEYAWNLSKIWWKHRDRYSRKCSGDCENCKCKHC